MNLQDHPNGFAEVYNVSSFHFLPYIGNKIRETVWPPVECSVRIPLYFCYRRVLGKKKLNLL